MDNLTEDVQGTANSAEAQKGIVAADLGKFKDVQALLSAYNNLEAEFTRRSQRLKELEEKSNPLQPAQAASVAADSAASDGNGLYSAVSQNAAVKDRIIGDYLKTVSQNKGAPFVTGGVHVSMPRTRPADIREAGRLAAEFLKKQ
ncbi:MAG: hypothetical protein LUI60_02925 [Clostridia bacterium]|nr:hypothetical protein [Clostridia bacterium]